MIFAKKSLSLYPPLSKAGKWKQLKYFILRIMKKIFVLAATVVAGLATMTSCGIGGARLTTEMDSLSYAIGTDLGRMAFGFDSTLNPNILAAAVKDVYAKNGKMTQEEAAAYIQEYMTVGRARKNAAEGQAFMEKAIKDGAETLASGLAYKIEKPGTDKKIALGDSVYAKYVLTLPNGQVMDQSGDNSIPFLLQEGQLIKGWIEGLPLIGEGGKITLFVPSDLAYGEGNMRMGPNQALKFDIEVTKVVPGKRGLEIEE